MRNARLIAAAALLLAAWEGPDLAPAPPRPLAADGARPPVPSPRADAAAPAPAAPSPGLEKIEHFVFIVQENRSFDHYFGTYPGADGIPAGTCLPDPEGGPCVAPFHEPNPVNRGGPHGWSAAWRDIADGRMDGFLESAYRPRRSGLACLQQPSRHYRDVMAWHDWRELPNYWNYARLYVLQDRMFEPVASYSLPAHLYLLAAQSGGYVGKPGQATPKAFEFPVITQVLGSGRVEWKYYVTSGDELEEVDGHVLTTPGKARDVPQAFSFMNPLPRFPAVAGDPAQLSRLQDTTQFYEDATTGNLPQVSWVIPSAEVSEHPPADVRKGMAYVTGLVNAVMSGPDWPQSAIFIAWDDWGGFYDHVPPTRVDSYGHGLRVPSLVVSPYAKQGFVDHTVLSFDAWLRLVEDRFGLPSLTERDRTAPSLLAAFDFAQAPRPPVFLLPTPEGSPYPQPLQQLQPAPAP